MTGKDYSGNVETATRFIKKYGQAAKILRFVQSGGTDYNPDFTTEEYACTVVEAEPYEAREIDGSLILAVDRRFEMAPDAEVAPTPDDKLEVDGHEYEIPSVQPLAPNGTVLKWTVQARR